MAHRLSRIGRRHLRVSAVALAAAAVLVWSAPPAVARDHHGHWGHHHYHSGWGGPYWGPAYYPYPYPYVYAPPVYYPARPLYYGPPAVLSFSTPGFSVAVPVH
jgi:hypothetical protein